MKYRFWYFTDISVFLSVAIIPFSSLNNSGAVHLQNKKNTVLSGGSANKKEKKIDKFIFEKLKFS